MKHSAFDRLMDFEGDFVRLEGGSFAENQLRFGLVEVSQREDLG